MNHMSVQSAHSTLCLRSLVMVEIQMGMMMRMMNITKAVDFIYTFFLHQTALRRPYL
uniref:Uncharacterized protein n=1 Tax=Arundo donax TaxID=35708 RepID=A0A0A9EC70_ARUDO